jgi:Sugar phosphate isomerases/epimerases
MSKYKIGCCIPGGSFMPEGVGEVDKSTYGILKSGYELALKRGFDFAEATVWLIMKLTDEEFNKAINDGLQFKVFNSFIPGSMPIISTPMEELRNHVETSMYRMSKFGAEGVIFGSGAARKIDESGDTTKLYEFIRMCCEVADKYNMYFALEPLNKKETNWLTSVYEGYEVCKELDIPNLKLLADAYHMFMEYEGANVLTAVQDYLVHVHVSDGNRKYPGLDGGAYMRYFAYELGRTNYTGRVSAECGYSDFYTESEYVANFMKEVF